MYYLESNTTFFTNPGHKERAATPTYTTPYQHTHQCASRELEKNSTDLRTLARARGKNHWHKESLSKTSIRTFERTSTRPTHTRTRTRKSVVCAECTMYGLALKLARVCACPQLQESKTSLCSKHPYIWSMSANKNAPSSVFNKEQFRLKVCGFVAFLFWIVCCAARVVLVRNLVARDATDETGIRQRVPSLSRHPPPGARAWGEGVVSRWWTFFSFFFLYFYANRF